MKMRSISVVSLCFLLMVGFSGQVGAFSMGDLAKLKETKQCNKCDLSGAQLTFLVKDLMWAQMHGANLTGANLTNVNLTGADLSGADLSGANLTKVRLSGANLTNVNLTNANLTGADLTRADLTNANLTGANLTDIQIDDKATATNKLLMVSEKGKKEEEKEAEKEANRLYEEKLKTAVGYKDLKIGMTVNDLNALNVCNAELVWNENTVNVLQRWCYDNNQWEFAFGFPVFALASEKFPKGNPGLEILSIMIGVYVQESHNKFRDLLGKKYKTEYNFTDIDVERYNKGEIKGLYDVFHEGQVALAVIKSDNKHASYIQYRNESYAKELLKNVIPKKDKSDDF